MTKLTTQLPAQQIEDVDAVLARGVAALALKVADARTAPAVADAIAAAERVLPAAQDAAAATARHAARPHPMLAEATEARTAADGAALQLRQLEALLADLRARATAADREAGRLNELEEYRAAATERDALVAEGPALAAAVALIVDFTRRHEANAARLERVNLTDTGFERLETAETILRGLAPNDTTARRLRAMRLPAVDGPGYAWPTSGPSMLAPVRPDATELAEHPLRRVYRPDGRAASIEILRGSMRVGGEPCEARMSADQVEAARAAGFVVEDAAPVAA